MSSKWFINRVGLLNFWYYQNQIFQLADGRMLLRGTNGSGKSLTMQSLFPVLFDGDTNAYRLDSFGSKDRKMEDYLLGEKGVSDRDEGTGYLFMEVKRRDREEYLTVGIGMHANRGGKLSKWFFAIENNQRIEIDFQLYNEVRKNELAPLSKHQLRNRLEDVGRLFDTQREYKHFVNERIFGFKEIAQFDELISLLINLRRPKLSKDFRPTVIYGILRDSLPKLKDEELITLSKTIEQIDGHRERLEDLENELKELLAFSKVYQRWNEEYVGQISGKWLHTLAEKELLTIAKNEQEKKQERLSDELEKEELNTKENEMSLDVLEKNINELSQHDGMDLVRRSQELIEQLDKTLLLLNKEREDLVKKQRQLFSQREKLGVQEEIKDQNKTELEGLLNDNKQYLSYLRFEEFDAVYAKKICTYLREDEFQYWKEQVKDKKKHFQRVKNILHQFEALQHQLKELEREEGAIQLQVDELNRDVRHWQETRQAEIERWKTAFERWIQTKPFKISDAHYARVLYSMDQLLEEEIREEVIYEPLTLSYQQAVTKNSEKEASLTHALKQEEATKHELVVKMDEWRAKKIPEPERSDTRRANREQQLGKKNFTSFYQAVDFHESVTEEERNRLEGALFTSGILDSLVSSEGLSLLDDVQVLPKPQFFTATLQDVLTVNTNLPTVLQTAVADVLQSILLDEIDSELPSIMRDGSYRIANLCGEMDPNYQASYIGATSQEQFRQRVISELENAIFMIDKKIAMIEKEVSVVKHTQQLMESSYLQRPPGKEVYQAIQEEMSTKLELQIKQNELRKKEVQVTDFSSRVNQDKNELNRITQYDGLRLEETVYEEAYQYADNYDMNVYEAYQTYQKIQNTQTILSEIESNLAIQEEEEEDLQLSISDLKGEINKQEQLIEKNQEQQKLMNIQELQAELSRARAEQKIRKQQLADTNQTIINLVIKKTENDEQLKSTRNAWKKVTHEESYWNKLFSTEVHIHLGEGQSQKEKAKEMRRNLDIKRLRDLEGNVLQQFNFLAEGLQNYQPQLLNVTVIDLSNEEEQKLGDFVNFNHYKQPKFTSEGQTSMVFDLLDQLKNQKLALQDLLKEDDEKLFKKIILESIGNILRSRINQAMEWVNEMNQLLQSQKNSSGLTLSIQWKGVPSTSEYDLGTNRLVELLQKDTRVLSETDQEAISRHFQEKVRYAQELVQGNQDERSTLFQAIAQVLDYRDWFEFELKFKRSNAGYQAQILTDRRFNQFSGGEKAVAMYLPLFTAVYSRYSEAEGFCPKVITLDEAFAGIDDTNISELFRACEELDFNYIMNSQALYGEYSTVSKLMIYELIRPQNANLVSTVRYFWNGSKKQMILEGLDGGR